MKRWLLLAFLSTLAYGQYPGNAPTAVQGFITPDIIGAPDWQITPPEVVTSGNLEVVCVTVNDPAGPTTYTPVSALGTTFANTTPLWDSGHKYETLMYYGAAASTGTETVSFNIPHNKAYSLMFGEFRNISATTDGTGSQTQTTGPITSGTTSVTTTKHGDLIINCSGINAAAMAAGSWTGPSSTSGINQPIALGDINSAEASLTFTQTGAEGSYSVTDTVQNQDNSGGTTFPSYMGMQSVAFKPSALAVTTTTLPNTDKVQTYGGCLQAVGGSGTYTWSVTVGSLPTGITLGSNGCFGGVASGATQTFTVQVLESGGSTTATKSLTLTIDNTNYSNPQILQSQIGGFGPFTLTNVTSGNTGLLIIHGYNTHGRSGWLNADAGASNNIGDSFGDTWSRYCPVGGTSNAPLVIYSTKFASSGNVTINLNKTSPGSALTSFVAEITGTQNVLDCAGESYLNNQSSSPYSFSTSVTTQTANNLLLPATAIGYTLNGFWSVSFAAGYSPLVAGTSVCCYDYLAIGSKQATTAGSYTSTSTVSSGTFKADSGVTQLLGLRMGILTTPALTHGERHRRHGW